jgi:ribosome biogenesis GTPase
MRELQLAEAEEGLEELFADVENLAASCRFNDCSHGAEPGCAVVEALQQGDLRQERLQSYLLLRKEEARNRESLAARHARDRTCGKKVRAETRDKHRNMDSDT